MAEIISMVGIISVAVQRREMSAVFQSCLLRVNDFAKRFYLNGDTIGYCPQL